VQIEGLGPSGSGPPAVKKVVMKTKRRKCTVVKDVSHVSESRPRSPAPVASNFIRTHREKQSEAVKTLKLVVMMKKRNHALQVEPLNLESFLIYL
jgi:hypothetical protein